MRQRRNHFYSPAGRHLNGIAMHLRYLVLVVLLQMTAIAHAQRLYPRDPNAPYQTNAVSNTKPVKAIVIHNYNASPFKINISADGKQWSDDVIPSKDKKIFYFDKLFVRVLTTKTNFKTYELSVGSYDLGWDANKKVWTIE